MIARKYRLRIGGRYRLLRRARPERPGCVVETLVYLGTTRDGLSHWRTPETDPWDHARELRIAPSDVVLVGGTERG